MTESEIRALVEPRYINSVRSIVIKLRLKGGFMAYGEFIRGQQSAKNMAMNKWVFSCVGIEIPIDGDEIESIEKIATK